MWPPWFVYRKLIDLDTRSQTYYEFTPFEFGSWRGRVKAFLDMEFLGTPLKGGAPANASICINGYDSVAFCAGTGYAAANLCEFSPICFWGPWREGRFQVFPLICGFVTSFSRDR